MGGTALRTVLFCLRSVGHEYGYQFLLKIVLPHPIRTFQGLKRYMHDLYFTASDAFDRSLASAPDPPSLEPSPVLGLGFCLKPREPVCISGRFNHDCYYFEKQFPSHTRKLLPCCLDCKIRTLGETAFFSGYSLYIMTSARDILNDLLLPAFRTRHFSRALLVLCAYSFEPFRIALAVSGLPAKLIPLESGDCKDYDSWRKADRGNKSERTEIAAQDQIRIVEILKATAVHSRPVGSVSKTGSVFYPI